MKKNILKIVVLSIVTAVIALGPTPGLAQEKKKDEPKAEKKDTPDGEKKRKGTPPIVGKIAAVDKTAKTVTIGKTVIQITSETRIQKNGKDATLDEIAVGDETVARIRRSDDGKATAIGLRVGPRSEGGAEGKRKDGEKKEKKKKQE